MRSIFRAALPSRGQQSPPICRKHRAANAPQPARTKLTSTESAVRNARCGRRSRGGKQTRTIQAARAGNRLLSPAPQSAQLRRHRSKPWLPGLFPAPPIKPKTRHPLNRPPIKRGRATPERPDARPISTNTPRSPAAIDNPGEPPVGSTHLAEATTTPPPPAHQTGRPAGRHPAAVAQSTAESSRSVSSRIAVANCRPSVPAWRARPRMRCSSAMAAAASGQGGRTAVRNWASSATSSPTGSGAGGEASDSAEAKRSGCTATRGMTAGYR